MLDSYILSMNIMSYRCVIYVFNRMCFQSSMALILTQPWKRLFVNFLPDWRSYCQYQTSSRYINGK